MLQRNLFAKNSMDFSSRGMKTFEKNLIAVSSKERPFAIPYVIPDLKSEKCYSIILDTWNIRFSSSPHHYIPLPKCRRLWADEYYDNAAWFVNNKRDSSQKSSLSYVLLQRYYGVMESLEGVVLRHSYVITKRET